MHARRPSAGSKRKRFSKHICESLEPRRLLTTFHGGQTFDFEDYQGNVEQISFFGNITAEVIGAQVQADNTVRLINLPAATVPLAAPAPLDSIFAIYVSQSDFTGGITVAQVPNSNFTAPVTHDPTEPFNSNIGQLRVNDAQTGNLITVDAPGGSGEALLGAVTQQEPVGGTPDNDEPILTAPVNQAFGVLPSGISTLNAGLTVAAGQNLGNFYFGGTVTGNVQIGGAINNFYAGWLLTGNANGESGSNVVSDPHNFQVGGDIRNLYVTGSIGTDEDPATVVTGSEPDYLSGFDMYASGTIGNVQSFGSIVGAINAANLTGVPNNGADQAETEFINNTANYDYFAHDELGGNANFENNSITTPQYLSNEYNTALASDTAVVVDGVVQDDSTNLDKIDWYAVPLLAGQTITVQVSGDPGLDAGVFDPDGREIASDYNLNSGSNPTTGAEVTEEQPFQFTTDRPGVYRFAVAPFGDSMFAGTTASAGDLSYKLTISNVGHMAIGSIVATNTVLDNTPSPTAGFGAISGDIGAIVAGGAILSTSGNTVSVEDGNLRVMEGATIGTAAGSTPEVNVPNGSVGLLESTGGDLYYNLADLVTATPAIGGDYQLVSSAGDFIGYLIANGNIGTVRAQSIVGNATLGNSAFSVDANHASDAGTIDLIDDSGDFGDGSLGGPSIKVGPDGSLTYLHVLGTVYGNSVFGQVLTDGPITYPASTAVPIVESSGVVVTLTPVVTSDAPAPVLSVVTYPLDDGGAAVVNVTSTGGLTVTSSGNISNQAFGIGTIWVQGEGNKVTLATDHLTQAFDGDSTVPVLGLPTLANTVDPLDVVLSGSTTVDVFDLIGGLFDTSGVRTSNGNFDEIANNTPNGEIVNIHAASIGTLTGGTIGADLSHSTPAALLPNGSVSDTFPYTGQSNTFPFLGQRTGVVVDGEGVDGVLAPGQIVSIDLAHVGNIMVTGASTSTTGPITANIGTITGTIVAPVYATGQINNVLIGTGIYPSGSGNLSNAGIYADGAIGNVVGNNADIRGNIASETGIQSVHLQNGSIINANISTYMTLVDSENLRVAGTIAPNQGGTIMHPVLSIGSIVTNGNGGIIGSWFQGGSIGVVSARNGFGIFQTLVDTTSIGTVGSIYADGYGLRGINAFGGYNVGSITATGNGSLDSTASFSSQVRYSETTQFDPFFGFEPNAATDIDVYLGTTAATPVIPGVTDTGVIENSSFLGNHNLGSVSAWSIRSTTADTSGVTTISFANSIGSIITTGPVDGMSVITGKLGTLSTGGDLMHTSLTISGHINNLVVRANLTDDSSIIAHGKNGTIGNLRVYGNVDGLIEADGGRIGNVRIYGSLFGTIKTKSITSLILYQNLGTGSLEITGNAGTIQFVQDLGPQGVTLTVDGKVNVLKVGSNLAGDVDILGSLGTLAVNGSIETGAKVTVGKILQLLKVGRDFQAGAVIQAHQVKRVKVAGVNAGTIDIV
jgi:hypothetical protein